MAAPAKFLFDMDFGAPDKAREKPATASEIAQKIAAAEARAYRDGFDAGQREAKAESDRRIALALEEIGIGVRSIATGFSGVESRMETEAVDVAVAVARKLCGELIAGEPLGDGTLARTGRPVDREHHWFRQTTFPRPCLASPRATSLRRPATSEGRSRRERLLRARCERPSRRRASEQRDELAPPHVEPPPPESVHRILSLP